MDGTTDKVIAHDGFTDAEGAIIANECYKGTIKSAGAVLRLFFNTVKPDVSAWYEPGVQDMESGINGVPLEADAISYGDDGSHTVDHIQKVIFYCNVDDNPPGGPWATVATISSRDPQSEHFEYNWTNSINDNKVWIKVIAIDDGDCRSVTQKRWIKIDSTRPTVTNMEE